MKKLAILLLMLAPVAATAANRFSVTSGVWNSTARWGTACGGAGGSSIPVAADDVFICNGTTITLNISPTVDSITINNGGTLTLSTFTLSLDNTPAFTLIAGGTLNANTSTVRFFNAANTTLTTGTFTGANSFYNVTINPAPGGTPRTYTFGGAVSIGNDFLISVTGVAAAARAVTVVLGGATTVGNLITIQAGGNETANLDTNGNALTAGRINIGTAGTLTADASTVTLNDATGPLLTRTGTFTRGTSTVVMSPTASVALTSGTFTGTSAFYNLTVNMAGLTGTLGADIDLDNTLLVSNGTLSSNGFAIAGDAANTMQVNNGAAFNMTATSVFPTNFATYTFQPTSTVRYQQTNAQNISAQTYGHLEASPAANSITQTFAAGATTVAGNLTVGNGVNTGVVVTANTNSTTLDVDGSLAISANSTLTGHASNSFTVGGNWTNAGTYTASGGTVTFDGTLAQSIGGASDSQFNSLNAANTNVAGVSLASSQTVGGTLTLNANPFSVGANTLTLNGPTIAGTPASLATTSSSNLTFGGNAAGINLPSSVTSLNNLVLNNTNATPQLTLNSSPTVAGILTLTIGVIVAGTNTLTTSANCPGSIVRTGGWVSGRLRMAFPLAGPPVCTFHIGEATTNYTPIRLTFTAITSAGSVTASMATPDHRNTTAGITGIDPTKSVNRSWTLANSTTLVGTYTARFTYIAGDNDGAGFANYRVRRGATCSGTGVSRTCTPWGSLTILGIPTNTITDASGIAISADGPAEADFSIGEADPSTNFQREKQFIYTRELY